MINTEVSCGSNTQKIQNTHQQRRDDRPIFRPRRFVHAFINFTGGGESQSAKYGLKLFLRRYRGHMKCKTYSESSDDDSPSTLAVLIPTTNGQNILHKIGGKHLLNNEEFSDALSYFAQIW